MTFALRVIPAGLIQTNAYVLLAPSQGLALLIDAPGDIWAELEPLLREQKCRLAAVWITHGHWDHVQGAAEVVRATGAKVLAHRDDRAMIETPQLQERFLGQRLGLEPVHVDQWVGQGDRLEALGLAVEVRHVPGHCPGSVLFYFPRFTAGSETDDAGGAGGAAFVGDALFKEGVGRTDLPGGDFATLEKSIRQQIYSLPDRTTVYPGHGPSTHVGHEKKHNPYVHG